MSWHVLAPISLCAWAYASALRERRYADLVVAIGFFFAELAWEMFNALVGRFAGAPLWSVAGQSAGVIYVGLNVEIALMFAIFPLVVLQVLPGVRGQRWLVAAGFGALCVGVEAALNRAGLLGWSWWFWRPPHLWLPFLAYALPVRAIIWVREDLSARSQRRLCLAAFALAAAGHLVLRTWLRWV